MKQFNKITRFVGSLSVGVVLFLLTLKYFDLVKTVATIRGAKYDLLILALALIVFSYFLRGRRWMIWEPGLKYWDSFKLILVGFMGNNILPARLGEVLRAHCAAGNINNPFGRTATLASIAIERILDGFVIALIGLFGLSLVSLDENLFWALALVCIMFLLLTAGMIMGNYFHLKIRALFDKIHGIFPGHLTAFGRGKANYFLDGLLLIRKPSTMMAALAMTCAIWGIELISYIFVIKAVFHGGGLELSLIFLSVVNFASLFPFTVGGLGAIEGATTPFLINAGIPLNESLAMVLIQHGIQFFFTTTVGGICYFTDKYYGIPIFRHAKEIITTIDSVMESDNQVLFDTRLHIEQLSKELGILPVQKRRIDLSIVIPAYNEKNRLPKTILETIKWCNEKCPRYEIIVVDDGSTDETLDICKLFSDYNENVTTIANSHLGKGAAVRSGMLNASGKYILFMDSDGATPLNEITKLVVKLDEGAPIAIGSRVVQDFDETRVITSFHRKLIGRIFAGIVNIFGISGIGDTQCGFKMFRREVVNDIFSHQKINGFAFDVEILFIAKRFSMEISEVPINWNNMEGSKVNLVLDSIKMLRDVLKIKLLHKNILRCPVNSGHSQLKRQTAVR